MNIYFRRCDIPRIENKSNKKNINKKTKKVTNKN